MLKGYLKRLESLINENNIQVSHEGDYTKIELNHITYMIVGNYFYTIDNKGFRTSENSIKPSLLLEILENEIQKHISQCNEVVEIKLVGNINKYNNKLYDDVLNDYRRIKARYDEGLKDSLPNKYIEICNTLDKLEKGCVIKFISGQNELIQLIKNFGSAMGSFEIVHMRDNI